jgi:hypothetical protein
MAARKSKAATSMQRRIETEMRTLGKRLSAIEKQARKSGAGLQADAKRNLRALQRQQAVAQRAVAKFGRQSYAASGPMVAGLHKAWRDIEASVRQAAKAFRAAA